MLPLILALSFFAFAEGESKTVDTLGPISVSGNFPNFGGEDLSSKFIASKPIIQSKDYTVISYFATWCKPCKIGLPVIEKVTASNDNVGVIYVNYTESDRQKVKEFTESLGLTGPVVFDLYGNFAKKHGVAVDGGSVELPKTFVVDKSGTVKKIYITEGSDFESSLLNAIK